MLANATFADKYKQQNSEAFLLYSTKSTLTESTLTVLKYSMESIKDTYHEKKMAQAKSNLKRNLPHSTNESLFLMSEHYKETCLCYWLSYA